MAKWLKSTTQKTYLFEGNKIPAAVTKDNEYLQLSDGAYTDLVKNKVVASLLKAGAIFVTDKAPSSPNAQVNSLSSKNAQLILENTKLQEQLAEAQKKLESASTGSDEETVKAAVAAQKAEDEAAVQKIVDEKDARIAELEAQLAKKTSKKASE